MDIIESIAAIPNTTENFTEPWFVVNRENGRMIERMAPRIIARDCQDDVMALIEEQVRLDSSVSYNEPLTIDSISSIGASTMVSTAVAHGLSSGDIVVLSCAGDFDGRFEVEEISDSCDSVLYLKFDGADGSTTFTDSSSSNHVVTAFGNAQIDTAQSFLGGASGLFDGNGDYIVVTQTGSINFLNDFTLQLRVRFSALPTGGTDYFQILSSGTAYTNDFVSIAIEKIAGNFRATLNIGYAGLADSINLLLPSLSTNVWYHMAWVRSGNFVYFFLDGVQAGATYSIGQVIAWNGGQSSNRFISRWSTDISALAQGFLNGQIDEYIITPCALWTADFTPPTTEFVSPSTQFRILSATLSTPIDSSTFTAFTGTGYARLAANQFAGLDHLEGLNVGILGDGIYLGTETVVGGSVTASTEVGTAHIGLLYYSDLITLDLNYPMDTGNSKGVKKKTGNIAIGFVESKPAGSIGEDLDNLYAAFSHLIVSQNASELVMLPDSFDWNDQSLTDPAAYSFTGSIRRPLNSNFNKSGRVAYRQLEPTAVHITQIIPEVADGEPV